MRDERTLSLHGEPARYSYGAVPVADGSVAYLQPNGGLGEANVGLVTSSSTPMASRW